MTQEQFFAEENRRNETNAKAYRAHMKKQEKLSERQVVAQEAMVQYLADVIKQAAEKES